MRKEHRINIMNNELAEFMMRHFRAWEKESGRRQTVSAFARFLGMNQVTINRYMNGDSKPEGKNLRKLAKRLSPEIYLIVGEEIPDDFYALDLTGLPPSLIKRIESAIVETRDAYHARKINIEDPEADRIATSIFERYISKYNSMTSDDSESTN